MDVLVERCAGLDVHQAVIVACALISADKGRVRKETREFASTVKGLAALVGWLEELGVSHVGMESTGVYWMPVFAALEAAGGIDLIVANAQHVKAVPGRKTDVRDAEWLAQLVRHGLMRKSFIPAQPFRDLRDLMRYRRTLVETQASERRRLIKQLEQVNVKLAGVLSDVFGVSGRAILRALIANDRTPEEMAGLARGVARRKWAVLRDALEGRLKDHHRAILATQLARVEACEADIAALDRLIREHLAPYAPEIELLTTIPGIDWLSAAIILAEIGTDLSAFPSAGHLAAWSGTSPGNNQSAGKNKPAAARKGNPHLKTALCNAAVAAAHKKGSYLKAKYYKLKSRIGAGKAIMAIAHKLVVAIFHVLTQATVFKELGETYLDTRDVKRSAQKHIRKLRSLGYEVALIPQTEQAEKAMPLKV
jgi:transposase